MKYLIRVGLPILLAGSLCAALLLRPTPPIDIRRETAEHQLQARQLFASFAQNEADANLTYAGKVIELEGELLSVERNEEGRYQLVLDTGHGMGNVVCNLEVTPKRIEQLRIGKPVSVKGVCTGYLFDVVLDHGMILHP